MADSQYPDEEKYLDKTVDFIDKEIERLKAWRPATAAHPHTAQKMQVLNDEKLRRYEEVRDRPYFGRVDFQLEDRDRADKRYIGMVHVDHHVFSWTSQFAKQLYYADPRNVRGYEVTPRHARGGVALVRGSITLKRTYAIDEAKLLDVTEIYQLQAPEDGRRLAEDSMEAFMARQLSRSRGGELREAVATIQPDQYAQIAATPEEVMLVQGVAGSGKSIVGLHRIAYLLSPFNERRETRGIDASRVVFFGPTSEFLMYVSNLLPSLDVRTVPQITVNDWLQSTLSMRVHIVSGEVLLEKLLRDRGRKRNKEYEAAKFKGSLQMAKTVEKYVARRRKNFFSAATALAVRFNSPTPIVKPGKRHRDRSAIAQIHAQRVLADG